MKNLSERENMLLVLAGKQPVWLPNFGVAASFITSTTLGRHKNPKTGYDIDAFGVEFMQTINGPMVAHTKDSKPTMSDVTKWKKHLPKIDLKQIDWEKDTNAMLASVGATLKNQSTGSTAPTATNTVADAMDAYAGGKSSDGNDKVFNYFAAFLWDELHYMMGFEDALVALATEPEACYDFLQAVADFWIEGFHHQCKYFKPDLAMIMDHVANANGMLMSPRTYREIIKPAQKKVIEAIRDEGIMAEMHVDGNISAILDDFVEIGVQVIQPFQIFNDIEDAKKKYGLIAIGGWDAFGPGNQSDATEEEVRQSVRAAMDAYGTTGRYAFWCSGATPKYPEKLIWIVDEAEKYGHNFYDRHPTATLTGSTIIYK